MSSNQLHDKRISWRIYTHSVSIPWRSSVLTNRSSRRSIRFCFVILRVRSCCVEIESSRHRQVLSYHYRQTSAHRYCWLAPSMDSARLRSVESEDPFNNLIAMQLIVVANESVCCHSAPVVGAVTHRVCLGCQPKPSMISVVHFVVYMANIRSGRKKEARNPIPNYGWPVDDDDDDSAPRNKEQTR